MTDMKTWRQRHDRFIAAIAARNAEAQGTARGYAVAIRPAFRPVAASALTAIANAVGAPVAAPLVALWSAPLEGVAEYDSEHSSNAFGRTLSLLTPSDAKQETLALRALAFESNAIAFAWVQHEGSSESNKSWLVLEPDSGAISLVSAPRASGGWIETPVAPSLDAALDAALSVGYWAGDQRQGVARYLDELGEAISSTDRASIESNRWLNALASHQARRG